VKQIHLGKRRPRRADRRQEPLPLDPRHPDTVKAHQLARRSGSHDTGRRHSGRTPLDLGRSPVEGTTSRPAPRRR
jgi:hypothetical protein